MAEYKTTKPRSGSSKGSTGRSRPSKKALEAEQLRLREEALKASMRRRHIATVIMFAVGIVLTLAAVIPAGEGEGWRGFFDLMHGLFGYSAFIVGPLVIFVAVRLSAFKESHKLGMDVLKCVAGILLLCAAVQGNIVHPRTGSGHGQQLIGKGKILHGRAAHQQGIRILDFFGNLIIFRPKGCALWGYFIEIVYLKHGRSSLFSHSYSLCSKSAMNSVSFFTPSMGMAL